MPKIVNAGPNNSYLMILIVTRVCCELTVTESGKGMSWILLLLLLHTWVSTIGIGGMSWILLLLLLHTGVTIIGTGSDRGKEYYIELTICRSINDTQRENCFSQFSTRIYWNRSLAASDVFPMFTQSITFYIFLHILLLYN